MTSEWRDNVWVIIGLSLVSIGLWVLGATVWSDISGIIYPRGFDPEDVLVAEFQTIPQESDEYVDYGEDESQILTTDRTDILTRLRKSPYVEYVGIGNNCLPYNMGFFGVSLMRKDIPDDSLCFTGNSRTMSADMVRVLRLRSKTGKTTEELANILQSDRLLLSEPKSQSTYNLLRIEDVKDHLLGLSQDTATWVRMGDEVECMKRIDYEVPNQGMIVKHFPEDESGWAQDIAVRVNPGKSSLFIEEFRNTPGMRRHGNLIVTEMKRLNDVGRIAQYSESALVRFTSLVMGVFMVIILLGLLGSFWFRVQQRVCEIAIRRVCGATRGDIFRRIIAESLILLIVATLLSAAVGWPIIQKIINKEEMISVTAIAGLELFSFVLMTIGISLSLLWPAYNAMKMEPAIAIKEE